MTSFERSDDDTTTDPAGPLEPTADTEGMGDPDSAAAPPAQSEGGED
jgi:hypothetical protein